MEENVPNAAKEELERELVAFIRHFPHVDVREIPPEVWEAVRKGESLLDAYRAYENGALRKANEELRERLEQEKLRRRNRERSAGSQRSAGMGRQAAEWEKVWEEE